MSLLEPDTTRKEQVNKLELEPELEVDKDKEYEVKVIRDSTIYINKVI